MQLSSRLSSSNLMLFNHSLNKRFSLHNPPFAQSSVPFFMKSTIYFVSLIPILWMSLQEGKMANITVKIAFKKKNTLQHQLFFYGSSLERCIRNLLKKPLLSG